ncbi:F-box protein At2g26160-like [Vicia villosa]|uniref:F-box protein At2g26160-like n=1 Tax=Vicia villosa TaxID=3911 RepID=UPI00273A854C|nr:F-box protein At2g26160-like [Vicia villosa]
MCSKTWDELPQDIVESISKNFTIYADYLRFRSVCHRWRLSIPKIPLHLPTQLPWLMLSHSSFFDLSTNKIHHLNLAPYSSPATLVCGSSHGWLVILNEASELRLLNPITLSTIPLPKLPVTVRWDHNTTRSPACLIKVVLSASPSSDDDDFTAFAMLGGNKFAFFRKGSDSWFVPDWNTKSNWVDVVYRNNSFFLVGQDGMMAVFDVDRLEISNVKTKKIFIRNGHRYLVFFKEDMLLVSRLFLNGSQSGLFSKTSRFMIYKMNWKLGMWEEIETLGKYSLFIGMKSSFCFRAADFVACRPNSIYFTDYYCGTDVGIYSLDEESIEMFPGYQLSPYGYLHYSVWVEPRP